MIIGNGGNVKGGMGTEGYLALMSRIILLIPFLLALPGFAIARIDSLLFVIRVDDITSRTTSTTYMPRGIGPFQETAEAAGAVVSWAVMPARLAEPAVNTGGELGRQLRETVGRGHEIVLHGFDHICDLDDASGHEMAFPISGNHTRDFTYAEQSLLITRGMNLLRDSVGVRPTTFVPPGHYSDAVTHQVLSDQGFRTIGINGSTGPVTWMESPCGGRPRFWIP